MIIILDNIRSMHNVGAIFRTADAFLVEGVYLCGITARPPHREIEKTALGATHSVKWTYFQHTRFALESIRKKNMISCAIEQYPGAVMLQKFAPETPENYALIFGNELRGVSSDVLACVDHVLEIPQKGIKKSFNVSVAVGIALWHFMHAHL